VQANAIGLNISASNQVVDDSFGHSFGIRRRIEFPLAQRAPVSGSIDIDEMHAAAHVLTGTAVFTSQENAVSAAIIVNHRQASSRSATAGEEKRLKQVALIRNLRAFKRRGHKAPCLIERFFKVAVGRKHPGITVRQVDERTTVKIRRAQVKLMCRDVALFSNESGGELFVLGRHRAPL
jgi:hypothetical protein